MSRLIRQGKKKKNPAPKPKKKPEYSQKICWVCQSKKHVHVKGWNGCECAFPGHPDKKESE